MSECKCVLSAGWASADKQESFCAIMFRIPSVNFICYSLREREAIAIST